MKIAEKFLPVTPEEVRELGRDVPDFVYVCGDAYVDHPSFGAALICRVLEHEGFVVAMLPQPEYRTTDDFKKFGRPRLGFLVSAGNIDSMVAHYTAAKRRRNDDYYSPGGRAGYRPDRAVIVYCNRIREAYGDVPIIIGGIEASLRRFAHYDYWDNKVRRSILIDSRADILSYGMGEGSITRIAKLLDRGIPVKKIRDVRGTAYVCRKGESVHYEPAARTPDGDIVGWDYDELKNDRRTYAAAFALQYENNDAVNGSLLVEYYGDRMLVQNPPAPPLEREELDRVYAIPFKRTYHPMYEAAGGIPAITEVKFSITHNRGCFGGCNFCALAFHQGRSLRSRSIESVVEEARLITQMPDFKGYIHDIGGPTANFRYPACEGQLEHGVCKKKRCLFPTPCKNLRADHSEYVRLLREVESLPGIKKVFIRSGIRFDYLLCDKNPEFFRKLVRDHVSGQLKVAPEHCSPNVLRHMGKPDIKVYDRFREKFFEYSAECGLEQYLVPYLMSSHPGSRMEDAVELALYTKRIGLAPEQVQDYYPTPGTASTVMYYTGLDPFTMKEIYTPTDYHEKQLQRALLQWRRRENWPMVREALRSCGREDLIGYGGDCLVPPEKKSERSGSAGGNSHARGGKQSGDHKGGGSSHDNRGKDAQSKGANKESRRSKGSARANGSAVENKKSARTNGSAVESKRNTQTGSKNPRTPKNEHRPTKKKK